MTLDYHDGGLLSRLRRHFYDHTTSWRHFSLVVAKFIGFEVRFGARARRIATSMQISRSTVNTISAKNANSKLEKYDMF